MTVDRGRDLPRSDRARALPRELARPPVSSATDRGSTALCDRGARLRLVAQRPQVFEDRGVQGLSLGRCFTLGCL